MALLINNDIADCLYMAVIEKDIVKVKKILDLGFPINDVDAFGENPFYVACSRNFGHEIVKLFIEYGADVNIQGTKSSPLIRSLLSDCGFNGTALALIQAGADPNQIDKDGVLSPLYILLTSSDKRANDVLAALLDSGANIKQFEDKQKKNALNLACINGDPMRVELLLNYGYMDIADDAFTKIKNAINMTKKYQKHEIFQYLTNWRSMYLANQSIRKVINSQSKISIP